MSPFAAQLFLLCLLASVHSGFPQTIELLGECVSLNGTRCVNVVNNCKFPVWPGVRVQQGNNTPEYTGFALGPRQSQIFRYHTTVTNVTVWGRAGCNVQSIPFNCDTGNCGPNVTCTRDAELPTSFVHIRPKPIGLESYEVSLMKGFNLPINISSSGLTTIIKMLASRCPIAGGCKYNMAVMEYCPMDLLYKNHNGIIVGCQSPCDRYDTDEACCRGEYNNKDKCQRTNDMPSYIKAFTVSKRTSYYTQFRMPAQRREYLHSTTKCIPVIRSPYTINFC